MFFGAFEIHIMFIVGIHLELIYTFWNGHISTHFSWCGDQFHTSYIFYIIDELHSRFAIFGPFLPACIIMWLFNRACFPNPLVQSGHLNGQDPLWINMCDLRSPGVGKDFSQRTHLWGLSWNYNNWTKTNKLLWFTNSCPIEIEPIFICKYVKN